MRTQPFTPSLATSVAATVALVAVTALAAIPANAQSSFGDTRLSYQNGVVYDDDLVPGRRINQPYLVGEQSGGGFTSSTFGRTTRTDRAIRRSIPQNSRNLIGADGKASK